MNRLIQSLTDAGTDDLKQPDTRFSWAGKQASAGPSDSQGTNTLTDRPADNQLLLLSHPMKRTKYSLLLFFLRLMRPYISILMISFFSLSFFYSLLTPPSPPPPPTPPSPLIWLVRSLTPRPLIYQPIK